MGCTGKESGDRHPTVAGIPAGVVGKPKFADPGKQMDPYVEFDFCI